MDVPIGEVSLKSVNTNEAFLTLRVQNQILKVPLKECSYFDPEMLYACTHEKVKRIQPTLYSSNNK